MSPKKELSILAIMAMVVWSGLFLLIADASGQTRAPTTHTIFVTGLEVKGGTSTDKLSPPTINPSDLSKGYEFKPPGEADKNNAKRWEVSSYIFSPSFVTLRQRDRVRLSVFLVNGDRHEVWLTAPDGKKVVSNAVWNRGREYNLEFVADKAGVYQLVCSDHAPTMIVTFLVLPR